MVRFGHNPKRGRLVIMPFIMLSLIIGHDKHQYGIDEIRSLLILLRSLELIAEVRS